MELQEEVAALWEQIRIGRDEADRVLLQVLLYAYTHPPLEEGKQGLAGETLWRLESKLRLPKDGVATAALPLLDTADERFKSFLVHAVYGGWDEFGPDPISMEMRLYALSSADQQGKLRQGVVELMYRKDAAGALLAIAWRQLNDRPKEQRKLQWAQHVIADVVWKKQFKFLQPGEDKDAFEQLEKLSRSEHWWIRLFAVEMLWRHEFLRRADLMERMNGDPHPLLPKLLNRPRPDGRP